MFLLSSSAFLFIISVLLGGGGWGAGGGGVQFQETQNATKTQHAHFKLSPIIYNNVLHTLATQGSHKGKQ